MNATVLAILIPAVATILTAGIGALVTITGRRRERRVTEIFEAFEERGKLVEALRERVQMLEKDNGELKGENADLRERVDKLEEMVNAPRRRPRASRRDQ